MNKIIIDNNKLDDCNNDNLVISNNNIKFIANCEYNIEIKNCTDLDINIEVVDNVLAKVVILSLDNNINSKFTYKLGENSNLLLFKFCSNIIDNSSSIIYLNGKYSKVSYNFSSICSKVSEYNIKIIHNNSYVSSNVYNKCIGNNGSKVSFNIDSILDKGNINCYMNQDTKIISMGDVDASIRPNMYIEEDDVEARHGSVIGRFSDDNLFYLMSRGIRKNDAIKLMIKGFLLSSMAIDEETLARILEVIVNNYDI